ncbi:hypothetical protein LB566_03205 [Mesorhizobium sp. CA13]|uniref:DUF6950 family protein n=1 Tax=Mesorhizobium sp. CA13 TaxID=2876643 RepID=UPI001CCB9FEC|nr:hypothetical protein [Mesorhizobium sp. CA13]MBZ9852790.1 hypothetical protein [Mesorhizobium sp. CA13]
MTTTPRLHDWDRRLARVTEKHLAMAGEWGVSDCLQTAGDAVEAVIATNPFAEVAGKYKTEPGAARMLRRRGFANVEEALASLFAKMPRLMARRGDLVVVERNGDLCAGYICEYGAAVKTEAGLTFVPQTEIRSAFRVGD